ncbi:PRTRC system ThiF family protein [Mucilaginibacter robiniae]|uniref:PRTRC system ThiF family protein n=1 Tax=Mucilaginibacter robiniae TaxID=2728022 RepID=A0A7L5E5A5_9SPHI|nr:PRTRC system ThiF family protein [Mucilaginibacter robiniae]QJD96023.1 PRTRC system ThiF family protein [Mucilaginibacter robiniae]
MKTLPVVHYTDAYLLAPTNPITVNLIGAGGTGSQLLTCLARMHQAMLALNFPGLHVTVFDDDEVSPANLGRQLFSEAEIGMNKGVALIARLNRFFGTAWKAIPQRFSRDTLSGMKDEGAANLYVSCVDTAQSRFDIAAILQGYAGFRTYQRSRPLYWMDLGNSKSTGQVLLSTVGELKQPDSQRYQTQGRLPFVTEMFRGLLEQADAADSTPSCSLAEALTKQDLFINSTLANMGASLLWSLFREGILFHRGFFLNLHDFRTQPVNIG